MWLRISRDTALRVSYLLDEVLPPCVRDSRLVMGPMMRLLFRDQAPEFMAFKDRAFSLTAEEFGAVYERSASVGDLQGETDLNQRCTDAILDVIEGDDVLEVGCGRGHLAGLMSASRSVTACDIFVAPDVADRYPAVTFGTANIERLPYADASFDTVVCTHTLEHVQHRQAAIAELRRVARRRLIVVVPRQRPYRYTFSLHIHFFPYEWSLQSVLGAVPGATIRNLGDWFYFEDLDR